MTEFQYVLLFAIVITVGSMVTTLGIRYRRISARQAAFIMVLLTYGATAIVQWGNNLAIVCMGSLMALGFSLPILGYGLAIEKRMESGQED
jgi:hypothetical protein